MEAKNDFTKGNIKSAILSMVIPMTVAQLVNVLYSVVDRMFIGHIPHIGSLTLTGLGLVIPVISIITAFIMLCGTGGGPLCSIARGRGDVDEAERVMGNTLTLLLIISLSLTAILQLFLRPILFTFGAGEETIPYAFSYARIYLCGTVFTSLSLGMNYFINAQGFGKIGMLSIAIGAVINTVLDPVLIFVLDMGIAGAAIATVISQFISALWVMSFLLGKRYILKLRWKNLYLKASTVGRILSLGTTGFVMSATGALVQISCNAQLQSYGGDLYVGAMTVINSAREVCFMIVHGITHGCQPVLGYNYGAKREDRVKEGIRFVSVVCLVYCALMTAFIMFFPASIIKFFNDSEALLQIGIPAIRIHFCSFVLLGLQMVGQCAFMSLGRAKQAIFFSLLRKVVIVVPLVYLLPTVGSLGCTGVYMAEPISDIIGGVACWTTMYFTVYRRLDKASDVIR